MRDTKKLFKFLDVLTIICKDGDGAKGGKEGQGGQFPIFTFIPPQILNVSSLNLALMSTPLSLATQNTMF